MGDESAVGIHGEFYIIRLEYKGENKGENLGRLGRGNGDAGALPQIRPNDVYSFWQDLNIYLLNISNYPETLVLNNGRI